MSSSHTLQSYQKYITANDCLMQWVADGASDDDIDTLQTRVQNLRKIYELEREILSVDSIPTTPHINNFSGITLPQIIDKIGDGKWVFDFDQTIATRLGLLLENGYVKYEHGMNPENYTLMPGAGDIFQILRTNDHPLVIITDRNIEGVSDMINFISSIDTVEVNAYSSIYNPKSEILLNMIKNNPDITVWNFVDDTKHHLDSIKDLISKQSNLHITLNLFHCSGLEQYSKFVDFETRCNNQEHYFSSYSS